MENIIITKSESIDYLQFKKLLEFQDDLIHAYTLKTHEVGFRKLEKNDISDNSYNKICERFNIDRKFILHPDQKHTSNICEYREEQENSLLKTDGIITDVVNTATILTFADCMSFFMYDPITKVFANIHSGWRGTVKRIGEKAITKMIKNYNCKPENIICCMGPCLHKEHFLVNNDVVQIFKNEFREICIKNNIIEETEYKNDKGKQYTIDTVKLNMILFNSIGLLEKNIIDSRLCTMCNKDIFHSFRVEGREYQLNASLMMLK